MMIYSYHGRGKRNCVKEKEGSRVVEPGYFATEIECVTFA